MKKMLVFLVVLAIVGSTALLSACGSDGEAKIVRAEYSPGEYFTTNVSGSYHLLKVVPILVVNREGLEDTLKERNATIRDTIIFILRDLTEEEITAPGNQDELRERIVTTLNERLGVDYFVEVIFNDFVMG